MTVSSIEDAERAKQARGYWKVDGIPTLVSGLLYLAFVGLLLVFLFAVHYIDLLKQNWFFDSFVGPVGGFLFAISPFWIGAAAIWLSVNWEDLIEWFKVRITYPRTGYVAPPSYWRNESATPVHPEPNESATPVRPEPKSRLWRVLSALGSFWFWTLLVYLLPSHLMHSRRMLAFLVAVLIVIRGIRFVLYPEATAPYDESKLATRLYVLRLARSTLNSFWVWIFVMRLTPESFWAWIFLRLLPDTSHLPPAFMPALLLLLGLGTFAILVLKMGLRKATAFCLSALGCAFLLWKNFSMGMAAILLFPGLWAAGVGSLRLYNYLRTNPIQSV